MGSMPTAPPSSSPLIAPLAALLVPLSSLGIIGIIGDRSALIASALLIEPLIATVLVWLSFSWLSRPGWRLRGLLVGLGSLCGLALWHLPPTAHLIEELQPDWAEELRACTLLPPASARTLRILSWTASPGELPPDPQVLTAQEPDLIVVLGLDGDELISELARQMPGEARFFPGLGPGDGVGVAVRGTFHYCGSEHDTWQTDLPSAEGHRASAIVAFPEPRGGGVIPLVLVRFDRHGPLSDWASWPGRLLASADQVATLSRAIGTPRMVLLGDFAVPRSFRRVAGSLLGVGLHEVGTPPTWPARLGPIPTLPIQAFDRVWLGEDWRTRASRAVTIGERDRLALVTEIGPVEATAR